MHDSRSVKLIHLCAHRRGNAQRPVTVGLIVSSVVRIASDGVSHYDEVGERLTRNPFECEKPVAMCFEVPHGSWSGDADGQRGEDLLFVDKPRDGIAAVRRPSTVRTRFLENHPAAVEVSGVDPAAVRVMECRSYLREARRWPVVQGVDLLLEESWHLNPGGDLKVWLALIRHERVGPRVTNRGDCSAVLEGGYSSEGAVPDEQGALVPAQIGQDVGPRSSAEKLLQTN